MAIPATRIAPSTAMRAHDACARRGGAVTKRLDGFRGPVALGEPVEVAQRPYLAAVAANRVGHLPLVAEQPIQLARVQPDAGDLALQLIGDVGVLRDECDIGW